MWCKLIWEQYRLISAIIVIIRNFVAVYSCVYYFVTAWVVIYVFLDTAYSSSISSLYCYPRSSYLNSKM